MLTRKQARKQACISEARSATGESEGNASASPAPVDTVEDTSEVVKGSKE